jgi:hypothetical protein
VIAAPSSLAGEHAIAAHGILQRPSADVDLFADWQRRADFPSAVDEVIAAYRAQGLDVQVDPPPPATSSTSTPRSPATATPSTTFATRGRRLVQ